MYELLHEMLQRPEPFSRYTAKELWTRPHLARQMLSYHLDQNTELASRRLDTIDKVVAWLDGQLNLSGKTLCDLGCGPGLYTQRFSEQGARVTGVDFSTHSLAHARRETEKFEQAINYIHADYLSDILPRNYDVITLIYCDFCVLSPTQRAVLLKRMHEMLVPGGRIVLDVVGMGSFTQKVEQTVLEERLMNGFWAEGNYIGIQRSFVYTESSLALDRYLIVEPGETWQIFNWFQHYSPESLQSELACAGFEVKQMVGSMTGEALMPESEFIGVIASRK